VPLEIARKEYINTLISCGMAPKTEIIPVTEAAGRMTSEAVYARISSPDCNASAMDGVALVAKTTAGASEETPVALNSGQYQRVNTGDPLTGGYDAVVMTEDVTDSRDGTIRICGEAAPWQNIRQIGEDICAGEMVLPSFSLISPAAVGAMITCGISEVPVVKRPVTGYIPTGDELVSSSHGMKAGDVRESNSAIFTAMIRGWGADTVTYPVVRDDYDEISAALKKALSECDVVILCGGSSAGSKDYSASVIADVGAILFRGLAIKPGRPVILGHDGAKPVLGAPGNPVSGIIVVEQLIRPIIGYLSRVSPEQPEYTDAVLSKPVVSALSYQEFIRARLGYVRGRLMASPLNRGSGVVTSFVKADGIIEIPQDVEGYSRGDIVSVRLLRPESELRRSILAIGSHDPLLDELSDLLRVRYGDISMGSAHVGSMGGLLAVRRGEAHIAGTHLLNEESGEYNISFIKKVIPKGGVRLIECVMRTQGLILQKGNPEQISGVTDLTRGGLRYVNRQKGSGTRILIDYLCRRDGVDASCISGYDREEYTHTSVAALIAAGSADAGLGIYSAAKLYGLDFIPVCREQYDLLIPDHAWDLQIIRRLLDVLKSDAFRQRLDEMGGYTVESPGTERWRA